MTEPHEPDRVDADHVMIAHLSEQIRILNRIVRDGNGAPSLMLQSARNAERLRRSAERIKALEDDVKRIEALVTLESAGADRAPKPAGWLVTRDDAWAAVSLLAGALLAWAQIYFTK